MRRHRLQVGDERHVRTRASDVGEVDARHDERFIPERAARAQFTTRAGQHGGAGKLFSTFGAGEVGQRDVHAVFVRRVARQPLPSRHARRLCRIV